MLRGLNAHEMSKTIEDKFTKNFFNITYPSVFSTNYGYLINHTKKVFIDLTACKSYNIFHPLPILTSEGNGNGLGDYYGENKELAGTWARDLISLEEDELIDFEEITPKFHINMRILW